MILSLILMASLIEYARIHQGETECWSLLKVMANGKGLIWFDQLIGIFFLGENVSSLSKAAEQEMLTALAARKEALLDKLKDRMEELKQLCLQEAVSSSEKPNLLF